jgi:beta-glucosidase
MGSLELNRNMTLGVACVPSQADGGRISSTWNSWFEDGRMSHGNDPATGAGHWERWREDIMLMRRLGIQTCRIGVEWARVQPQNGVFDEAALSHLKEEILLLRGLGIQPLLTLHQFNDPVWFAEMGGWEEPDNIRLYLLYVEKVVRTVGHLVSEYITIFEPNTYAVKGWYLGTWPPGVRSMTRAAKVMSVMAAAHIRAYKLIHTLRRGLGFTDTRVSCALQMRVFEPKNRRNPIHASYCSMAERFFQTDLAEAVNTGKFTKPLKNYTRVRAGHYCDFHAMSYCTRSTVSARKDGVRTDGDKSDTGLEIYSPGIVQCGWKLMDIARLPIYITDNGVCDRKDVFRARFIYEHLEALCRSELPVKRYYHRSFLDGFEWTNGYAARYGLVRTEFPTMERAVKRSGDFYSQLIRHHGVTEELYEEFVAPQNYHK